MSLHPPFIETVVNRIIDVPSSASIDTSAIDKFRQGVSLRTNRHRFISTQPKMWVGDLSHKMQQQVFGSTGDLPDDTAFDDMHFDIDINRVIDLFETPTESVTTRFSAAGDDDGTIENMNGVIEIFDIREIVFHPGLKTVIHRQYGVFGNGNIDIRGNADQISQELDTDDKLFASPFTEIGRYKLGFNGTYISENMYTSGATVYHPEHVEQETDIRRTISPFSDIRAATLRVAQSTLSTERIAFHAVLLQLSGSTDIDELEHTRTFGAGFTYHGTAHGMESIAFGGLMRYRA